MNTKLTTSTFIATILNPILTQQQTQKIKDKKSLQLLNFHQVQKNKHIKEYKIISKIVRNRILMTERIIMNLCIAKVRNILILLVCRIEVIMGNDKF